MKKQFLNIASVKVYATAILTAAILTCTFTQANATEKNKKDNNNAVISWVSAQDNVITFNVNFTNPKGETCLLILSDEQGEVLYQKRFSERNFNKNILVRTVGDNTKVNIAVKSPGATTDQTFEINTSTRVIEEVVVTKL